MEKNVNCLKYHNFFQILSHHSYNQTHYIFQLKLQTQFGLQKFTNKKQELDHCVSVHQCAAWTLEPVSFLFIMQLQEFAISVKLLLQHLASLSTRHCHQLSTQECVRI